MRIISKPAIRDGWPKKLFHQPLVRENVERGSDGVAITLIVKDIYTKGANQRYTIKLTADDLAMIVQDKPAQVSSSRSSQNMCQATPPN